MTDGPAEVQILREEVNFMTPPFPVPVTRMACRTCGIRKVLPVMQARAYAMAHNKEFHPYVTVPNPDHLPIVGYEVVD